MATPKWQDLKIFAEKIGAYLANHERIIGEFERSLGNAGHYIELAQLAKQKEPENTATLLEQIKEIDLLGHLSRQFEAFQEVSDLLPPEEDETLEMEKQSRVEILRDRYELLLEEAESQQEAIRELTTALENPA